MKRNGINYELDLREGIDLSIFIFGSFQKNIFKNSLIKMDECRNIIDVGANIGSMSLSFAKYSVENAKVLAIEPTEFALRKLQRNLDINKDLSKKITVENCLIGEFENKKTVKVFSSWRIDGKNSDAHPMHGGASFEIDRIKMKTLDELIEKLNWKSVDIIKIDTDGHEWSVLNASKSILEKYHPKLIVEFAKYAIGENGNSIDEFIIFLKKYDYQVYTMNGVELSWEEFKIDVPDNYSKDYIFI